MISFLQQHKSRLILFVTPTQLIFLIIFITLNSALFIASESITINGIPHSATYHNASDGQRYWGAAINLAEKGEFSIPRNLYSSSNYESDPPLARAGPLPAFLFAIPMKIVGFQNASVLIVSMQCILLLVMGLLIREIGEPFGARKDLLQGLVIFNPNLIGLAHHAQSDFLFGFIASVLLLFSSRIICQSNNLKTTNFLIAGLVVGLLALTRPVGYYYAILFPLLLVSTLFISRRQYKIKIKNVFLLVILSTMVTHLLLAPWMLRNFKTFGDFSITQNEKTIMLDAQYDLFLTYNSITNKEERKKIAMAHVQESLLRDNECVHKSTAKSESETIEKRSPSCEILSSIGYLRAFSSEPPSYIFRALFTGWGSLFFAGGAGRLQQYLGLEAKAQPYMFDSNVFRGFYSLFPFLFENAQNAGSFFSIFIPVTAFSIMTRLFGVVGLIVLLKNKSNVPILTFHLFTLIILTAFCMFYSMVRYRAPMEPILMVFSSIGIATLLDFLRRQFRSVGPKPLIK